MSKKSGYISLYRSIQKHPLWEDKPFTKGQAWIDLLLRASYDENETFFNGNIYKLEEGDFITSIQKLASVWGWSRGKVHRFLDLLKGESMISYQTDTHKTVIKVLNFKEFQTCSKSKQTTNGQQTDSQRTANGQQTDTINKYNNSNKENNYSYASPKRKELTVPDDWLGSF